MPGVVGPAILTGTLFALGLATGMIVSWRVGWRAAGPIALLVAAPLIPNVALAGPLSADDILPLAGVVLLLPAARRPRITRNLLTWVVLLGAVLATVARVVSTIANAPELANALATLAVAVVRPAFLVAAGVGVALTLPDHRRRNFVAVGLGLLGTFEAVISLAFFVARVPGLTNRPARLLETLGSCEARITGTLGLSPNHIGAVFVVTIPFTVALAIAARGHQRWLWALASALQTIALLLTFTRASIVLALLAALVLVLYYRRVKLAALVVALSLLILLVILPFGCPTPTGRPDLPGAIETPAPGASSGPGVVVPDVVDRFADPSDRAALWYTAARMTLDYPVAGVGIGRMVDVMQSDPARYVHTPYGTSTASAHNTILLAGAETGVLGALGTLLVNVALGLAALRLLMMGRRAPSVYIAAGVAILAFEAQGMVNNLITVPATGTLLAVIAGAFATARRVPPGSAPSQGPTD